MREPSEEMRRWLTAWGVTPTGSAIVTPSSELMPGLRLGDPVMLKIARVEEEARGAALLQWWGGRGAAPVLEREGWATLMVRATGTRDLTEMAVSGQDAAATEILVRTALDLHDRTAPSAPDALPVLPLGDWFRALLPGEFDDPLLRRAAGLARRLIDGTPPADVVVLHGDIHHGNVLDFGDRWAAIDPKGLIGHRAFDLANILCNPSESSALTNLPARLAMISRQAGIDPLVLTEWTIAWCGLSSAWELGADVSSEHARTVRAVAEVLIEGHPAD
jgi:streptomycin 6-kinase